MSGLIVFIAIACIYELLMYIKTKRKPGIWDLNYWMFALLIAAWVSSCMTGE